MSEKHAEAEGEKLGMTAEGERGRLRKGIKADMPQIRRRVKESLSE